MFSQTTGDPEPFPGMAVFHLMFLVSLHSRGGFASGDEPFPSGPLQWDQVPADAREVRRRRREVDENGRGMTLGWFKVQDLRGGGHVKKPVFGEVGASRCRASAFRF